ncbi:unnamed protein product [Lactuca saligna]|uniref:Uncharacterized protein n=1 Tax=Lactuca saligna TaxID=75948 RepID=A0AA35ZS65_LACSI|nr:unnamed protein product [Lactuca saligna]
MDGVMWRHQQKLPSFQFSTKVLQEFSTDLLMRSTLDSMFKVEFGFDLDTLSGSNEASNRFMEAFDESNGEFFNFYTFFNSIVIPKPNEPFVSELLTTLPTTIVDLEPHQIHTSYEYVGHMIQVESKETERDEYLQRLMDLPNQRMMLQPPPSIGTTATKVLCLTQVVTEDELKDDEDYQDILEYMKIDCGKFGSLVNVVIPLPNPTGEPAPGVGNVKLMEERNMKPLDSNLAALSARCSKDLELNLTKSFLSEMGQDATLLSWNLMYRVDYMQI